MLLEFFLHLYDDLKESSGLDQVSGLDQELCHLRSKEGPAKLHGFCAIFIDRAYPIMSLQEQL